MRILMINEDVNTCRSLTEFKARFMSTALRKKPSFFRLGPTEKLRPSPRHVIQPPAARSESAAGEPQILGAHTPANTSRPFTDQFLFNSTLLLPPVFLCCRRLYLCHVAKMTLDFPVKDFAFLI
ncbi:hypothetical protein CHARACLAT_005108, partial [Characodon lateralis]|nr:hypothetical protein [Characodon lateralis]